MKPKYIKMYMEMAEAASRASDAKRTKVGCCIVTDNQMCAIGLNGTPPGWYTNECEDEYGVWGVEPRKTYLETKPEVRHAERAAFDKMLAEGVSSRGAILFTTLMPCEQCALSIIGAQISRVIYKDSYRCTKGIDMLKQAGILTQQYDELMEEI